MLDHIFAVISIILVATYPTTVDADHQNLMAIRRKMLDVMRLTCKTPPVLDPYPGEREYCTPETEYHLTCPRSQTSDTAYKRNCCVFLRDCPDKIRAGQTKYGITNNGEDDINSCMCDTTFRDCLNRAYEVSNLPIYEILGKSYFNIKNRQCYIKSRKSSCNGLYYDEAGHSYQKQIRNDYFCPIMRYHKGY